MTPFLWGLVVGLLLTHVGWALVFAGVWWRVIHRTDPGTREAIEEDFRAVRDAMRRADHAGRN